MLPPDAGTGRVTIIAPAFALGIAAGSVRGAPPPETWLVATAVAGTLAWAARRNPVCALVVLALAIATLGGAWVGVRRDAVGPDDLLTRLGAAPVHVHAIGTALGAPERRASAGGALGRFDYRGPYAEFSLAVEALVGRDGRREPVRGRLLVRVGETTEPFRAGDRVVVRGTARRGTTARNPGGFDHDRLLRSRGYAGVLSVADRDLLTVTPVTHPGLAASLARVRAAFRIGTERALFDGMPTAPARNAVLAALLFGSRDREGASIGAAFRRVGLAHLLAISGLHLGILVGLVMLAAGVRGGARTWHAGLVAGVVLVYLLLIDVRLPVLRAAVMTTAGALARAGRRRWPGTSLVALSGAALLAWRPQQLFEPGFQLSFGVVLALVHYGPGVRARWFGRAAHPGATTWSSLLARGTGGALATAAVAWAVATPITVYHFGMVSPGAVPLSVAALPILTALLAIGYLKILVAALLPSVAAILGLALVVLADALVVLVTVTDAWPGSVVHVPRPAPVWALLAAAWSVAWARGSVTGRARRRVWMGAGAGLVTWLAWPALPFAPRPDLRIDTLAVGNGTCHVLRSAGRVAVVDAGSSSNPDAGRTVVVPALRALGVRAIDWIAISHANLDHFSAVPEVLTAYPGTTVVVSPQLIRSGQEDPDGPAAFLLAWLARERVPIRVVHAHVTRPFGAARVRWLHPPAGTRAERENDNSLVLAVETMHRRALFTGDIEPPAIARLRERHPALTADVLELPHHGAYSRESDALLRQVDPAIVLQSTGHRRLERDAWATRLGSRRRLVTARDGACRVEITGLAVRFGIHGEGWIPLEQALLR